MSEPCRSEERRPHKSENGAFLVTRGFGAAAFSEKPLRNHPVPEDPVSEPSRSARPGFGTAPFRKTRLRNRPVPKDTASEPRRFDGPGFGTEFWSRAVPEARASEPRRSENGRPNKPENSAALRKGGFRTGPFWGTTFRGRGVLRKGTSVSVRVPVL